jgi:hypothetical protein
MSAMRAPYQLDDYRKPDKRTEVADLREEISAAGQEMETLGRKLEYAVATERDDLANYVALRLRILGAGYRERGSAA